MAERDTVPVTVHPWVDREARNDEVLERGGWVRRATGTGGPGDPLGSEGPMLVVTVSERFVVCKLHGVEKVFDRGGCTWLTVDPPIEIQVADLNETVRTLVELVEVMDERVTDLEQRLARPTMHGGGPGGPPANAC